jgi:hypothetical protein
MNSSKSDVGTPEERKPQNLPHNDKANPKTFNTDSCDLTVESFKKYPGCEHYSHEEAAEIVESLGKLARILYEATLFQKTILIDNQCFVYSKDKSENNLTPVIQIQKSKAA